MIAGGPIEGGNVGNAQIWAEEAALRRKRTTAYILRLAGRVPTATLWVFLAILQLWVWECRLQRWAMSHSGLRP